ncbi:MAG: sulfatase-like hydrolase/transferase [Endomicrobium sp.]|jgi:phosphoglycerol transferase MdoB-like AlkP superfamily enzyme|nr:sulfatase-like hydrolase/transferase [Endomicrobium sp.]
MNNFKTVFLKLAFLNFIFLAAMSAFRAVFFFYFGRAIDFTNLTFDIFKAFCAGLRYDLAVIADINIPVSLCLIALLFIAKNSVFDKFLTAVKWYYTFVISAAFIFLCVDFGFYSYFQNHINVLVFGFFEDDTSALISTIWENYNVLLIFAGFACFFVLFYFISKTIFKLRFAFFLQKNINGLTVKILIALAITSLNFIAARGGVRAVPLEVDDADVSSNMFLNKTAINGFYTFGAAYDARKKESKDIDLVEKAGYKNNIRQAFADFLNADLGKIPETNPENSLIVSLPESKNIENVKPNVILIVMESFGADLLRWNSSDFDVLGELKKHFDEDIVFYNFLPGSGGTMVSLETIVSNLPQRPVSTVLAQSKYAYKKYPFAASAPYKKKGFETSFIYGGGIGWRNAAAFMANMGFDNVLGAGAMNSEYPRNQWGVYDKNLFDFVYDFLEKGAASERQQFMLVLTTTNHPPYSLPADYEPLPLNVPETLNEKLTDKDLAAKRFAVYQYANAAAGEFITKIKNSKFAKNTIIAITGDHNFWGLFEYPSQDLFNSRKVPFYLYIPQELKPFNINLKPEAFGSHTDIMPTLYELSLSSAQYMSMGKNLLSAKTNIAANCGEFFANGQGALKYNLLNKNAQYFVWSSSSPLELEQTESSDTHKPLIKRALSQTAIADYLLKRGGS